jgi:RNA polymerase sigma-70 factor (ECF subfamily)
LVLKYFDDLRNDVIAEILDIPLGTVKSRIHNALIMLRKQIEGSETGTDNQGKANR